MLGYYTVKLLGADSLPLAERIRLETSYVTQLEVLAGGQAALLALCAQARKEPLGGPAHERLRSAGVQAEAAVKQDAAAVWPGGGRFSLAVWTVQDL